MDTQSIQVQALITFIMPFLIQLAKRSQSAAFAWIDQRKPKICVIVSATMALATSLGIDIVHAPHQITVSWPEAEILLRGVVTLALSSLLQFAAQHMLYDGFWRHIVASPSNQMSYQRSAISGQPALHVEVGKH